MSIKYKITYMNTIGQRIKQLRTKLGLKQEEIAKKIGVTGVAFGNWERDVNTPKGEHLTAVCKILKTTPDYIISGKELTIREARAEYNVKKSDSDFTEFREVFESIPPEMKPAALRMLRALLDSDTNTP